jgi:hypothetical protein
MPDVSRVRFLRLEFIGPKQIFPVGSVDLVGNDVESNAARRLRTLERALEDDPAVVDALLTVSDAEMDGR